MRTEASSGGGLDDPRRALEPVEERRAVAVGDPGVDRRAADRLVPEVVLDELERHARVQEVRGDRVPEAVAGVAGREPRPLAVAGEEGLDLALAQRPPAAGKERIRRPAAPPSEIAAEQPGGGAKERLLGPGSTLEALDHDPAAREIDVLAPQQRHLPDPQAVVVDEREQGAVAAAEGLAEWHHRRIRAEWGLEPERGKRYSFGYSACPDLADQAKLFAMLEPEETIGVTLTSAYQLVPEASTSAIILHHPAAVYYMVKV